MEMLAPAERSMPGIGLAIHQPEQIPIRRCRRSANDPAYAVVNMFVKAKLERRVSKNFPRLKPRLKAIFSLE